MDDAAFLFGLRARIGEKKTLAADDGSFEDEQAAVFAGVDRVDLFVERLLIDARAVDEHGDDVRMAQAVAMISIDGVADVGRVVGLRRCGSVFARPFLLRLF